MFGTRARLRSVLAALGIATALALGMAGTAGAQDVGDPYAGPRSTVLSNTTVLTPQGEASGTNTATAESTPATEVEGTALAFTGGDVLALAAIGAGAVLVGGLALVARRRNPEAA